MFQKVTSFIFALLLLGCSNSALEEGGDPNAGGSESIDPNAEIVITPSERSVVVNEPHTVTFEVACGESDITSVATIYHFADGRSTKLEGNSFEISTKGEYLFYALYKGRISERISVFGVVDAVNVTASRSYTEVNSDEPVALSVVCGGVDVTAKSTLYVREKGGAAHPIEGATISFDSIGEKEIYAIYNGVPSNDITIRVLNYIADPVADAAPDRYDGMLKRLMMVHVADVGCSPCVSMVRLVHSYLKRPIAANLIYTSAHGPLQVIDPMSCTASNRVMSGIDATMFPTLNFAFTKDQSQVLHKANSVPEKNYATVDPIVSELFSAPAKSGISARSLVRDGVISLRADIKINTAGHYGVGVWLVEDEVYHLQAGAMPDELEELSSHRNVVRDIYPFSTDLMIDLGGTKNHSANTTYEFCCDFPLSEVENLEDINLDNLKLVFYIYDHSTNLIDNSLRIGLDEEHGFEYSLEENN